MFSITVCVYVSQRQTRYMCIFLIHLHFQLHYHKMKMDKHVVRYCMCSSEAKARQAVFKHTFVRTFEETDKSKYIFLNILCSNVNKSLKSKFLVWATSPPSTKFNQNQKLFWGNPAKQKNRRKEEHMSLFLCHVHMILCDK